MKNKIFGIGFPKTGTTTLNSSLNTLGINSIHDNTLYADKNPLNVIENELSEYSGFSDSPIFRIYKELFEKYPQAKFILTYRESNKWWKSWAKHHFLKEVKANLGNRSDYYSRKFKDLWIEKYQNHNNEVKDFFRDKKHQFLEIDLTKDSNPWDKLCNFLEKQVPLKEWPHLNKLSSKTPELYSLTFNGENKVHKLKYFLEDQQFKTVEEIVNRGLKNGLYTSFLRLEKEVNELRLDIKSNENNEIIIGQLGLINQDSIQLTNAVAQGEYAKQIILRKKEKNFSVYDINNSNNRLFISGTNKFVNLFYFQHKLFNTKCDVFFKERLENYSQENKIKLSL